MSVAVPCPTLGRKEAAEFLGVQEQTLAAWACNHRYGLPFIRVGRRIRYSNNGTWYRGLGLATDGTE
jgi:excisionase family DNA binding protein